MRKFYYILLLLIILNIVAYISLNNLLNNQIVYEYKYCSIPLIIQKNDIELVNIDDFNFNDYFDVLTFDAKAYKYSINEENKTIDIYLKDLNCTYSYSYKLIEPKIITETKYITETVYVDNSEYTDYSDNHIYYENDYYEFSLGTDLSTIIETVQDDIECYTNVTCDYSCLNPYELGEYDIYFYNDYQKIIKKVKIM